MYAIFNYETEEITSFKDWSDFTCHIPCFVEEKSTVRNISYAELMSIYSDLLPQHKNMIEETIKQFFLPHNIVLETPIRGGGHPYVETLRINDFELTVSTLNFLQQHIKDITNLRMVYQVGVFLADMHPDNVYFMIRQYSSPESEYTIRVKHKIERVRSINDILFD